MSETHMEIDEFSEKSDEDTLKRFNIINDNNLVNEKKCDEKDKSEMKRNNDFRSQDKPQERTCTAKNTEFNKIYHNPSSDEYDITNVSETEKNINLKRQEESHDEKHVMYNLQSDKIRDNALSDENAYNETNKSKSEKHDDFQIQEESRDEIHARSTTEPNIKYRSTSSNEEAYKNKNKCKTERNDAFIRQDNLQKNGQTMYTMQNNACQNKPTGEKGCHETNEYKIKMNDNFKKQDEAYEEKHTANSTEFNKSYCNTSPDEEASDEKNECDTKRSVSSKRKDKTHKEKHAEYNMQCDASYNNASSDKNACDEINESKEKKNDNSKVQKDACEEMQTIHTVESSTTYDNKSSFEKTCNEINDSKTESNDMFIRQDKLHKNEYTHKLHKNDNTSAGALSVAVYKPATLKLDNAYSIENSGPTAKQNNVFLKTLQISNGANKPKMRLETLGDALRYFGLYSYLGELDRSLEDVRRHVKSEIDHEEYLKHVDKKIQKLSLKYHPDKAENIRGIESELAAENCLQVAINNIRTLLKYLNTAFLKDIRTAHKFEFYDKLNIKSLCNENEIESRIFEMKLKIYMISKIKQKNIILEIRKFLTESKRCVDCYLKGELDEIDELISSALSFLNCAIEGYNKLCMELCKERKRCEKKNEKHMVDNLHKIENYSKRDLKLLQRLEKTANSSLKGKCRLFKTDEIVDPYLVRPFICYTNIILLCSIMARRVLFIESRQYPLVPDWKFSDEFSDLQPLYDLAVKFKKNSFPKNPFLTVQNEVESKFREKLEDIHRIKQVEFNVDHYSEIMVADILSFKLENCMMMMNEFQEKSTELSENFKEFHKKSEKMEEKFKEIKKFMQSEEMNESAKEIKEILEDNKTFYETVSDILSELS